ncbi:MAG: hypothetical protein RL119_1900 [Actinomycetota bacterium]|jgi:chromosome segregation ATPase
MGLFKRAPKAPLATEVDLYQLRLRVAELTSQLNEVMNRNTESEQSNREISIRLEAAESRITQVGSELTNQLNELSGDIETVEQRTKQLAEVTSEIPAEIDLVRRDQEELAQEQARYQIAFRQDLADAIEMLQKKR